MFEQCQQLTLDFDMFAALPEIETIGFALGLTVAAFVAAVDGADVTRFFVLFPVWPTRVGFFAFCVEAAIFRVVDVDFGVGEVA